MSNISTATYIKKLVKIIYEKEKQIQQLKRSIRSQQRTDGEEIDLHIRSELQCASTQLKEVNSQIHAMEHKMEELEAGLEEEIAKNGQLEEHISILHQENRQLQTTLSTLNTQISEQTRKISELQLEIEEKDGKVDTLNKENMDLVSLLERVTNKENKTKESRENYEKELAKLRQALKVKEGEVKTNKQELSYKDAEISALKEEIKNNQQQKQKQINQKNAQIAHWIAQIERFIKIQQTLDNQMEEKNRQLEQYLSDIQMKDSIHNMQNQTLKTYEEFAYEITQYIESAYLKHCCQGHLRSSKKLIKDSEKAQNRLELAYKRFSSLQIWMEQMADRIEKNQIPQLGEQTVENLSVIVRSFEQKLQICDLTEKLQKEKEEMDKVEEQLLQKFQKECEKSYERDRSKIVQLDEVKEVLKMTKDVNRELMDEINQKEYIIMQCRKVYNTLLANKSHPDYRLLKQMLNIKHP